MLKFTRISGIMDMGRLGNALARPGIDPRTWFTYGTVDAVGVDQEGAFVDLTLLPSGASMTARAGTIYAGPGYGFHVPFGVGDEVVVAVPDGDPAHGGVVVARMQSASDELSVDAQGNKDDIVLVVKSGQSLRVGVAGGGKVFLGQTAATDAAVLGSTYRPAEDTLLTAVGVFATACGVFATSVGSAVPALSGAAATLVTAAQALTQAIQTFQNGAQAYLSQTVEVGK